MDWALHRWRKLTKKELRDTQDRNELHASPSSYATKTVQAQRTHTRRQNYVASTET